MPEEPLYTIERAYMPQERYYALAPSGYRVTIHETGEIREARTLELLFRSLVRDFGFYLRKVR